MPLNVNYTDSSISSVSSIICGTLDCNVPFPTKVEKSQLWVDLTFQKPAGAAAFTRAVKPLFEGWAELTAVGPLVVIGASGEGKTTDDIVDLLNLYYGEPFKKLLL